MTFYIVALAVIVGLAALLWRKYKSGENWQREASFFVDLLAMGATALIVGGLALSQLENEPPVASDSGQVAVVPAATESVEPLPEEVPAIEVEAVEDEVEVEEPTPTRRPTRTPTATETSDDAEETEEETGTPEEAEAEEAVAGEEEAEPTPEATATPEPEPTATPEPTPETQLYTVQEGDRLSLIATRFGVTTEQIAAANPGLNIDQLSIGQQIVIPSGNAPSESPPQPTQPSQRTYTVQEGDYLGTIANRFGVTTEALIAANPGLDPDRLSIGQVIVIP